MNKYIIQKERNTLTITVKGATVTTENKLTAGKYAGKTLTKVTRYGSNERAQANAEAHARRNGWKS